MNAVGENAVEISSADGLSVKVEFDPATGLPARETYQEDRAAKWWKTYSDWRDAGGMKMPFKGRLQQDGKKVGDVTVSGYQFNTGLKAEDLSKKP